MKVVIIPQKMAGTGTIHDLASQHRDREIKFRRGMNYAVILADYYGGKGYTTHATQEAALKQCRKEDEYSLGICDSNETWYHVPGTWDEELRPIDQG